MAFPTASLYLDTETALWSGTARESVINCSEDGLCFLLDLRIAFAGGRRDVVLETFRVTVTMEAKALLFLTGRSRDLLLLFGWGMLGIEPRTLHLVGS